MLGNGKKFPWLIGGTAAAIAAAAFAACAAPAQMKKIGATVMAATQKSARATYTNPVIDQNFPDPSILSDRGAYYAYATNSGGTLPCAKSTDLVHWTILPDAMPTLPAWVQPGRTWAPNVRAITPGKSYVCYFTAHDRADNTQAIGVATSASPEGPFVSHESQALINTPDLGGAIDPSCFIDDDGAHYLLWKNDGNSKGQDTWLWIQKLSADGLTLVGEPTKLLKQNQKWEGPLIEAPTLWKHGGKYYLFYSGSGYGGCSYAIGYAVADSLLGPYVKPRNVPFQASTADVCGPGGEDIVQTPDGRTWMAYHYWRPEPHRARVMAIDPLVWDYDVPYLLGPSQWPQAAPDTKGKKNAP